MARKTMKVVTRRKKFIDVEIPLLNTSVKIIGNSPLEVEGKVIKLDLTRQLKGKSLEINFRVKKENEKAIAHPIKLRLLTYFIRRMMRKRISYVEDSIQTKSKDSLIVIKPFMITRKRVSRAVRKTLRNKARNWLEDYVGEREIYEIFKDVLSNKIQKPLSLMLKKTYPLSLCEIRILEVKRPLKEEEIKKKEKKEKGDEKEKEEAEIKKVEGGVEIEKIVEKEEEEKVKEAEEKIKKTQKKAAELEKEKVEEIEKKEVENKSDSKTSVKSKTKKAKSETKKEKAEKKTSKKTSEKKEKKEK